jgi:1L-myo-inositol 1-phosphate cytidylyltransferase / CDP-L-myo-inositol myo-inositolphosphotransferase
VTFHAVVFADAAAGTPVVAGVPVLERLLRTLARAGVTRVVLAGGAPESIESALARDPWARRGLEITLRPGTAAPTRVEDVREAWPEGASRALVIPSPGIADSRVLKALVRSPAPAALVETTDAGTRALGPASLDRSSLDGRSGDLASAVAAAIADGALATVGLASLPAYIPSMRRSLRPYWLDAPRTQAERQRAEDVLVEAAQKRALDFPAYAHAPVEDAIVRAVCATRLTPNQVSLLGNLVAWTATGLFATGHLGWAIVLALVVGVLDGVDGKLARVKVETSAAGKLEHWFDTLFEVSWAVALAFYLARSGERPDAWWLLALLLGSEALDGVAKGAIILRYGRQIDDVAPLDRLIRLVGGRRNVYVWIMAAGIAAGRGGDAFAWVAWWEATTSIVHLARAAWLVVRPHPLADD